MSVIFRVRCFALDAFFKKSNIHCFCVFLIWCTWKFNENYAYVVTFIIFFYRSRCSACDAALSNWYFEKDGLLFCKEDYWNRYGEACQQCSQVNLKKNNCNRDFIGWNLSNGYGDFGIFINVNLIGFLIGNYLTIGIFPIL